MTEINLEKDKIYVYGKYYDYDRVKIPKDEQDWSIIVYVHPLEETNRIISSLEGVFISENILDGKNEDFLCNKNQRETFEKEYKGKFVPLEKNKIYVYGKCLCKFVSEEDRKTHVMIYVNPILFEKTCISSLEGIFISDSDEIRGLSPRLMFQGAEWDNLRKNILVNFFLLK